MEARDIIGALGELIERKSGVGRWSLCEIAHSGFAWGMRLKRWRTWGPKYRVGNHPCHRREKRLHRQE